MIDIGPFQQIVGISFPPSKCLPGELDPFYFQTGEPAIFHYAPGPPIDPARFALVRFPGGGGYEWIYTSSPPTKQFRITIDVWNPDEPWPKCVTGKNSLAGLAPGVWPPLCTDTGLPGPTDPAGVYYAATCYPPGRSNQTVIIRTDQ